MEAEAAGLLLGDLLLGGMVEIEQTQRLKETPYS